MGNSRSQAFKEEGGTQRESRRGKERNSKMRESDRGWKKGRYERQKQTEAEIIR